MTRREIKRQARRILAERHLYDFALQAWHVVEPGTKLIPSWHLKVICEHLEACTRGEIRRLMINIPPRCMKSLLVSVFWPCWTWTQFPESRWIFASYAQSLSTRDSIKCRDVIQSPWYQDNWGDRFTLKDDQNQKTRFDNDKTGFRLATSVGGAATGEGGQFLVADDPHNVIDGESETERQSVIDWWDGSMSTRGNDPKTVCHVVVMQRVHEADLCGHLAAKGGYEHLCLPMRYDSKRSRVALSRCKDPRTVEGESICPDRFGEPEIRELERRLGAYRAAGQLQQEPAPSKGGIFDRARFRYFKEHDLRANGGPWFFELVLSSGQTKRVLAESCLWFQTVDTAMKTAQHNDYTAIGTFCVTPEQDLLIYDMFREKIIVPKQFGVVVGMRSRYPLLSFQAVEDKASGTDLIQRGALEGVPFKSLKADVDKVRRASNLSIQYENEKVFHRQGAAWIGAFEDELMKFPTGAHDDQVDVAAHAANELVRKALRGMGVQGELTVSGPGVATEKQDRESLKGTTLGNLLGI